MGKNLYWQLPPTEQKSHDIGNIKYEVARYLSNNEYDGDYLEEEVGDWLVPFLEGVKSTGSEDQMKDAEKLITAINKYGTVILVIK